MLKEPQDLGLHNEDMQISIMYLFKFIFPVRLDVLWIVIFLYFKNWDSDTSFNHAFIHKSALYMEK